MKNSLVKMIAIMMTMALCLALVPMSVFAEEEIENQEVTVPAEKEAKQEEPAKDTASGNEKKEEQEIKGAEGSREEGEEPQEADVPAEENVQEEPADKEETGANEETLNEVVSGELVLGESLEDAQEPEDGMITDVIIEEDHDNDLADKSDESEDESNEVEEATGKDNQEEEPEEHKFTAHAKTNAKLYKEPTFDSGIRTRIKAGTPLEVLGVYGDWAYVSTGEKEGYIYREDVSGVEFHSSGTAKETAEEEKETVETLTKEEEPESDKALTNEETDVPEEAVSTEPAAEAAETGAQTAEESSEASKELTGDSGNEESEEPETAEEVDAASVGDGQTEEKTLETAEEPEVPEEAAGMDETAELPSGNDSDESEIPGIIEGEETVDDELSADGLEADELLEALEPAEETEEPEPVKTVKIWNDQKPVMELGDAVTLYSRLEGFEDCEEIHYQWEADKGSGFEPVSEGNSSTYTFYASRENVNWIWRLNVTYK